MCFNSVLSNLVAAGLRKLHGKVSPVSAGAGSIGLLTSCLIGPCITISPWDHIMLSIFQPILQKLDSAANLPGPGFDQLSNQPGVAHLLVVLRVQS